MLDKLPMFKKDTHLLGEGQGSHRCKAIRNAPLAGLKGRLE